MSGKNCKNRSFHHYRDFKHTVLAEERALAGSDSSDIDLNLQIDADIDLDNISEFSSGNNKRKLNNANEHTCKRTKSINNAAEKKSTPEEDCNPFFSPSALDDEQAESGEEGVEIVEDEPNPFLDAGELHVGQYDAETVVAEEETEEQADEPEQFSNNDSNSLPCIPGVCGSKQLAVTVTVTNPATGEPVQVSFVYFSQSLV